MARTEHNVELPPEFLYQKRATDTGVKLKKTGVIAPPGSGKTRICLNIIDELDIVVRVLAENDETVEFPEGPVLVVGTGSSIKTWVRQTPQWLPFIPEDEIYIVRGKPHERRALWNQAYETGRGVYITNYSVYSRDVDAIDRPHGIKSRTAAEHWGAIICDEYHKAMLNRSKTWDKMVRTSNHIEVGIWTSGSGLRKNPASMFTLFHLVNRKLFSSYWKFVNAWCLQIEGYYGLEIVGPKNVEQFKKVLNRWIAVVPDDAVADQLPEGKRVIEPIEMDKVQEKIYEDLLDEMLAEVGENGNFIWAANSLHRILILRKLLCCPKLIDPELGRGAGLEYILEHLEYDPHCLIFVPFREACDIVADVLKEEGYTSVGILRGGTSEDEQQAIIDECTTNKGIIIATIAYGESWEVPTAKTTWMLGYDYVLDINIQCEGRTRRAISEHKFVTYHYIKYVNTIDEAFMGELDIDLRNYRAVMSHPKELVEALRGKVGVNND